MGEAAKSVDVALAAGGYVNLPYRGSGNPGKPVEGFDAAGTVGLVIYVDGDQDGVDILIEGSADGDIWETVHEFTGLTHSDDPAAVLLVDAPAAKLRASLTGSAKHVEVRAFPHAGGSGGEGGGSQPALAWTFIRYVTPDDYNAAIGDNEIELWTPDPGDIIHTIVAVNGAACTYPGSIGPFWLPKDESDNFNEAPYFLRPQIVYASTIHTDPFNALTGARAIPSNDITGDYPIGFPAPPDDRQDADHYGFPLFCEGQTAAIWATLDGEEYDGEGTEAEDSWHIWALMQTETA